MNNYEAPVVIQMGPAHALILGPKPFVIWIDSEGTLFRADCPCDIDEGDE